MRAGGRIGKRSGCTFRLIQVVIIALGLILFRHEIVLIFSLVRALGNYAIGAEVNLPPADTLLREVLYILLNLASYALFAFGLVYLIGGHILPLSSGAERWDAMRRFYRFFTGERRVAIRVREGRIINELPPGQSMSGGVAIVDPNSAIVLEKLSMPATSRYPLARVGRPGVVFIQRGERLRGIVSLRKQARANIGVHAQTSDGIEMKTNVSAVFTLGQPAAVVKVAYVGEQLPYNLRVLQIDATTRKITAINDELDEEDKREIHRYAQQFLTFSEPVASLEPDDRGQDHPPYPIDEARIFAAVYSFARNPSEERVDQWTDLPALVATEIFRNMIAHERYDALFITDESDMYSLDQRPPGKFRLQAEIKPLFARRVRYLGVMSYQFIQHTNGRSPAVGLRLDSRTFRISPVQDLRNSKVLRDRGIKVLAASFSELTPTDPKVYEQRIDNWRARVQQRMDLMEADLDRATIQIQNQARSEAHLEMTERLNELLQKTSHSEEAFVMHLYQMLQEVAEQPESRRLLPPDTLKKMTTLLLPEAQSQPAPKSELPSLGSGAPPEESESNDTWNE